MKRIRVLVANQPRLMRELIKTTLAGTLSRDEDSGTGAGAEPRAVLLGDC